MNEDTLKIPKSIQKFDSSLVFKKYGKEIWMRNISKVPNLYNSQLIDPNTTTFEFYVRGDSVSSVIKSNFASCFFSFSQKRGIFSTTDLYLLPNLLLDTIQKAYTNKLIGSTNQKFGDTLLTNNAVYNFEVGTEFHRAYGYRYWYGKGENYCYGYKKSFVKKRWETDSTIHFEAETYFFANCKDHESEYPYLPYYFNKEKYDTVVYSINKRIIQGVLPNSIYIFNPWNFEVIKGPNKFGKWHDILTNSNDCENFYGNTLDSLNLFIPLKQEEKCDYYGSENQIGLGIGTVETISHSFDPAYWQRTEYYKLKYIKSPNFEAGTILGDNSIQIPLSQKSFFPNPTSGIVNLSNSQNLNSIQIFNLQGKMVKEVIEPKNQIDLGALQQGIYILHFISPNKIETHKVILNK